MIRDYTETAQIKTTGETVTVLRRVSIRHDEAIMTALERTGCFVIGTPARFPLPPPQIAELHPPRA